MKFTKTRKVVAMLLLFALLFSTGTVPVQAFANDTWQAEEATVTEAAAATEPPVAAVDAETGQKAESPADSVPTDVFAELSPTEEAVAVVSATETTETTEQPDPAAVDPEASEDQEPVETGSASSLADKVADVITSIFDSLRGESANLTIPYRIYGAGANFGQVLKFWFQYPKNDTGHNVSLEGLNGHYINNTVAYCLEPHRSATAGTAFSKLANNSSTNVWTQKLSQNQRNAIALTLAYGAPKGLYSNDTNTERGYEVATQIIVWEIIAGDRGAMKPFSRSNDRIYKFLDPIVKTNQNNLHTINYNAFVNGYTSITNKLTQYGRVPSFASATSANAQTHTMTYNAGNNAYSITLTDTNNVLGNYSFTNGNGLTFTKSGNKLTVTATVAAMQNAPVLISAAGNDFDVSGTAMVIWGASGNQVMCQMTGAPAKLNAYFKLNKQPEATVSLKKTINASQSVLDCIKGNDLYTLKGAVYEIHHGSASGTVVDTLTTDKDGNAKSTKKYPIGTVLYAVEKTAPSGYLIDSNPVKLTVSATESNNVFKVSDKPTFDPNTLQLKKTGSASEKIQGAVFKVEFYAQNWTDDNKLQRTWYFQSDKNGVVKFMESYFAPGYTSDSMYKPNGAERLPLGCALVQEIKAAPGYKLPAGNDGKVFLFIRQGGTKVAKMGAAAGAYWGNGSADPLNTSNPKGIYKIENDSVKTTLTGVNAPDEGTATMQKLAADGDVEGYCFKLYQWGKNKAWYGKSDKDGNIYVTDQNYAASGTKVYSFEGLTDGKYTFLEALSKHGKDNVWPESIRITVENGGKTVYDKTFSGEALSKDANGDCRLGKNDAPIEITGLNGKGKMTITINNKPIPGSATMQKLAADGDVEGYCFKLLRHDSMEEWYGKSDEDGNVYVTDQNYAASDTKVYSFEGLQDGDYDIFEALSQHGKDNVWPESIQIKVDNGGETVFDRTYSGADLQKEENGDCCLKNVRITGLDGNGNMTIIIHNKTVPGTASLKKTAANGDVEGYCFKLLRHDSMEEWYGKSDGDGNIYVTDETFTQSGTKVYSFEGLTDGKYTLLEVLSQHGKDNVWPESIQIKIENGGKTVFNKNYKNLIEDANGDCRLSNVTLTGLNGNGRMTITINNVPTTKDVEIIKTSPDGKIEGISFNVEQQQANGQWTKLGTYKTDENGKIVQNLAIGTVLRITEIVPDGYICLSENPQIITTSDTGNRVAFENQPVAPVEIVKSSPDGKVAGIDFTVEEQVDGKWTMLGTYKSDKDGKIDLGEKYVGTKLRIKEIVPENYICTSKNPQTITVKAGKPNKVSFANKPIVQLELLKTSDDGKVDGIEFVLEQKSGSDKWTKLGSYITDTDGRITVTDLTEGASYRLTEIVPEGYISENQVQEFVAQLGTNTVSFSNRRIYGDLELTKVDEEYPDHKLSGAEFTVTLKNGSDTTTKVMTEVVDKQGKGTGVYRLEHLEYGTVCEVRETKAPEGYLLSDKEFEVTIQEQKTYVIKDKDFDSVTNRRIYGDLELTKVDEEYPDHKLSGAEFTVTMTLIDGSTETAVMEEVKDAGGKGTGVYRLEHIAYGTVCEVRETGAPEGYELSDEVWIVTISEEKTYTIATPNFDAVINRQQEGQIRVHKEDAEGNAMRDVQFLLEYSMDNGTTWASIQARTVEDKVLPGYCASEGLTNGILTTGEDGNVVFTGLALSTEINSNVLYRLTEVKTQNGSTLMGMSVFEGPLTTEEPDLSYKVVNGSAFKMPMTGGNGFNMAVVGFALVLLAAMLILFNLPKKKEENN